MSQSDPVIAALVAAITPAVVEQYPGLEAASIDPAGLVETVLMKSAAAQDVVGGDPIGMVRMSVGGDLARRVVQGGVPMWQVNLADGSPTYYDMEPTLDWPAISTPPAAP